jgi:hypothetical protein
MPFDVIDLLDGFPALKHFRGEIAVVGEKHHSRSRVFKITDRIDALGKSAQQIAQRLAAFRISQRRHNFRRLVHQQVDFSLFGGKFFAGNLNLVGSGVGLAAEFADSFAVYFDLAADNQLFGMTPRSYTRARNNLL